MRSRNDVKFLAGDMDIFLAVLYLPCLSLSWGLGWVSHGGAFFWDVHDSLMHNPTTGTPDYGNMPVA